MSFKIYLPSTFVLLIKICSTALQEFYTFNVTGKRSKENKTWTNQKFITVLPPAPKKEKVTLTIFLLFPMQKQGTAKYNVKFNQTEKKALKNYFLFFLKTSNFCRGKKKFSKESTVNVIWIQCLEIFNGSHTLTLPTLNWYFIWEI